MTGSEKVFFGFDLGMKGDLAGDATGTLYGTIRDYKDSVDYVTSSLGCDTTNCGASNTPMAFEFMFDPLTSSEIDGLIADIQFYELEFHLSPERGAVIPEPSTYLLLGSGLAGLAYVRRRFKK